MNREVRKLAWFVWRHYPPAKDWGRKLLMSWLGFHCSNGFAGAVVDREAKQILAVGIARPVMNPEDGHDTYEYDDEGRGIFVDLAIAPNTHVFKGLFAMMVQRFGQREFIAFKRGDSDIHVRSFRAFRRNMLRKELTYHGLT